MRDDSRLGQTSGAGGVDVDQLVVVVNLRLVGLLLAGGGEQGVQVLGLQNILIRLAVVVLVVVLEQHKFGRQILGHLGHGFDEVLAVDEGRAVGHRNAVQQGGTTQVGVDQRGDDANLGQTQPSGNVFGTVLQEKSHNITFLVALGLQNVGHLVGVLVHLAEGPALGLADNGHLLGMAANVPLEDVRHRVVESFMAFRVPQQLDVSPEGTVEGRI